MAALASSVTAAPDRLQEAIRDSHYLLAYFSRAKVNIPAEKRAEFNQAVTRLSTFRRDRSGARLVASRATDGSEAGATTSEETAEIAKFWNAFIFLSDLAYPATIESIRYYLRFYYDGGKRDPDSEPHRGRFRFRNTQWSFFLLTVLALFMTIGLSLLSYIGAQALIHYDDDYAHWSQVQNLVRYLDEGGKAIFTGEQTTEGRRLVIKLPNAVVSGQINPSTPIAKGVGANNNPATLDSKSDVVLQVPTAQIPRITAPLIDANLADGPPASFGFSCPSIISLFASARGTDPNDPPKGALTLQECLGLMAAVKPHVLSIADDLAFTYSSMTEERKTLTRILDVVSVPARMAEIISTPLVWVYEKIAQAGATQLPAAQAAETNSSRPSSVAGRNDGRQMEDTDPTAGQAYYLFVLLQQRHIPIPFVFPNPSVRILGTVFDARLAVSITNTYLLTLAFGFLGACVWVLREINARLQDFTLAPSLFPRYWARILLGMVAGPTIGLFFQDGHFLSFSTSAANAPNLSTQLSAAAIAFVAGFSIEILFAILERFIRIIQEFAGPAK